MTDKKDQNQRRALVEADTEFKTFGCRIAKPNFCRNNSTPNKCAFVRDDNMCLTVPRSWKKIFLELRYGS
jgi:hypothetical protein